MMMMKKKKQGAFPETKITLGALNMLQGQDGELRKRKKKLHAVQKINDFKSKLACSRQTLPRGRPEPGQ